MKITLYFTSSEQPIHTQFYTHYSFKKDLKSTGQYCDIRKFVHHNQDQVFDELEAWHRQLSQVALKYFSHWWLNDGSRLKAWAPPIFNPLVFMSFVYRYCQENDINEITLRDCPQECLDIAFEQKKFFDIKETYHLPHLFPSSPLRKVLGLTKHWVLGFLRSFRFLITRKRMRSYPKIKRIIYSHVLYGNVDKHRPDHFYCHMFDNDPKKEDAFWFYYSSQAHESAVANHKHQLNELGKQYTFHFYHNRPWDYLSMLGTFLNHFINRLNLRNDLPKLKIGPLKSNRAAQSYFSHLIADYYPLKECELYYGMKRCLRHFPNLQNFLYPYEEKALERAILLALKTRNVLTIGYAHSIHNPYHLYFHHREENNSPPRPDFIAVTGPEEKKWLMDVAHRDGAQIKVIGSSRYEDAAPLKDDWSLEPTALKVLVLIAYPHEPNRLADILDEYPHLFERCQVTFRHYPFGWIEEQMEGIQRIQQYCKLNVDTTTNMHDQIKNSDVILYNSTSAGKIAALCGRIPIMLNLCDILKSDPTAGKSTSQVLPMIHNPLELKETLDKIRLLSKDQYWEYAMNIRRFVLHIYAKPDLNTLDEFGQ